MLVKLYTHTYVYEFHAYIHGKNIFSFSLNCEQVLSPSELNSYVTTLWVGGGRIGEVCLKLRGFCWQGHDVLINPMAEHARKSKGANKK